MDGDSEIGRSRAIQARLVGGFGLFAPDGSDIAPRGSKARALLAMLLTTPDMCRSRQWLKSGLWSRSGGEQANSSLRQALSEIRRSFRDYPDLMKTDRSSISLTPDCFHVDLHQSRETRFSGREILEGLSVNDPCFDVWLELLRSRHSTDFTRPNPVQVTSPIVLPQIVLDVDGTGSRLETLLSETMSLQVGRNLTDVGDLAIVSGGNNAKPSNLEATRFELSTSAVTYERAGYFTLRLADSGGGEVYWTRQLRVPLGDVDLTKNDKILHLAYEAAEQAADALMTSRARSQNMANTDTLVRRALTELFSFDAERLRIADGLFEAAHNIRPSAVIYAWRCFVRLSMVVERTERNVEALRDEADQYAAKAIELDPKNSLVLAIVSQFYILMHNDVVGATQLAKDAEALNAGNPMAHVSLALVALRLQNPEKARALADRALFIAAQSPHRHWWHMFCCLAEISCGDMEAAISSAKAALVYAPKFRPPMRHLYALYLKQGNVRDAIDIAARLRKVEPDFSLRMIREDGDYPAGTLRKSGLIEMRDVT